MHSSRICHEFDGHNRKIHTVKGFVLEKPRIAMDFYSREHVVALLKIKTFTGKLWKHVERRVLLWTRGRAHGSRKINDGKPPFRVTAAFISLSLSLSPSHFPYSHHPRVCSFVRRKGRNLYHVFPSQLRYEKEYRVLGAIFNRLSIVVEWKPAEIRIKCARSVGREINTMGIFNMELTLAGGKERGVRVTCAVAGDAKRDSFRKLPWRVIIPRLWYVENAGMPACLHRYFVNT